MRQSIFLSLLLTGAASIAQEPQASAPEATRKAIVEPAPADLINVVADIREVNTKLEMVCRMQYSDVQCTMPSVKTSRVRPAIGTLQ